MTPPKLNPSQVAEFMLRKLEEGDGYLSQEDIANQIYYDLDETYIYENDNGNLAISPAGAQGVSRDDPGECCLDAR